jgi:hypothetical protein
MDVRSQIGKLFQDPEFAREVANLMRPEDGRYTPEQWDKIAMSLPRFYAVVEAAEIAVRCSLASDLVQALERIANPNGNKCFEIACVCARLAWQAQQPLLGKDRLERPIMGCTSGNLPDGEFDKDAVRVRATAALLVLRMQMANP